MQFGACLKNKRIKKGITLREFCRSLSIDSGNHSKLERGLINPPLDLHKIYRFCRYLGEDEGSAFYDNLVDYAYADNMRIPKDIKEHKVLFPVFFRAVRDGDCDKLLKLINNS